MDKKILYILATAKGSLDVFGIIAKDLFDLKRLLGMDTFSIRIDFREPDEDIAILEGTKGEFRYEYILKETFDVLDNREGIVFRIEE